MAVATGLGTIGAFVPFKPVEREPRMRFAGLNRLQSHSRAALKETESALHAAQTVLSTAWLDVTRGHAHRVACAANHQLEERTHRITSR